ncbi:alpha/beta hydrolase [Streptacidiphilus cavernicola]|uniref:Alpha/beta hydrolase n=1 Tax=Streptacidiphilus cavernicola TaxID=3342716 RepID=A0ABV6VN58_9ACTN
MTALTAALVSGVDPVSLSAAGQECDALSVILADRDATLTEARGPGRAGWHGIAADHAALVLQEERQRLTTAADQFRALASLLVQAAEELTAARAEVRTVLAEARAAGCAVHGDTVVPATATAGPASHTGGTVVGRSGGASAGAGSAHAAQLTARLAAALAAAERTDQRCAAVLAGSAAQAGGADGLDPDAARTTLLAAAALVEASLPAPDSTPAQVHSWWLRLDPRQREMLLRDQPQLVGSLDGVPAAARDRANRALLDHLLADGVGDGQGRGGGADSEPTKGLLAISDRLARQHGASPPALLLSLGLTGQGRAVLSFGDPDTADHICVYVPGMGTTLADVAGKDGDRALALHAAAVAADRSARPGATAAMVWLGYDAPQGLSAAAGDSRAAAGAVGYDRFLRGLRVTGARPPARPPAHLTALGHSYGSLLVGLAARRPGGTGADDLVLIGSPGTGARHASELGVAPGRVWVGAAPQDPVSSLLPSPRQGGLIAAGAILSGVLPPLRMPVQQLAEERGTAWFGTNPAAPSFGARPLPVDGGRGPGGGVAGAHSHYLDPGSRSLAAIGRIIVGGH